MSFILDALRKSEHERQQNRAPGISAMRTAQKPAKRSIWLPLAALLAGLNIALLGLLWYAGGDEPAAVSAVATPQPPAAAPVTERRATNGNRELAAELEPVDEPSRFATIAPPAEEPAPQSAPVHSDGGNSEDADDGRLPTVTEAVLDGRLNVRPLRMDLHVYSDNPGERFVFINTTRYSEGDRTNEGLTVRRINQEGVVLSYQGQDFLLTSD